MKSYLELICICKLCKLEWRINLNHHIKGVGTGSHIDGYQCPNCQQKDIDFDIMRIQYPCHEYIHIKYEDFDKFIDVTCMDCGLKLMHCKCDPHEYKDWGK